MLICNLQIKNMLRISKVIAIHTQTSLFNKTLEVRLLLSRKCDRTHFITGKEGTIRVENTKLQKYLKRSNRTGQAGQKMYDGRILRSC